MSRRAALTALRVTLTLGAFAFLVATIDSAAVGRALARVAPAHALLALAITSTGLLLATLRWRVLLLAYGAPQRPAYERLLRLYLVGLFYNTFLPGAVGGDVVRGWATREAFGGAAGSLAVVLVERLFGVAALLTVAAAASLAHPLAVFGGGLPLGVAGLLGALGALGVVSIGRRLGGRLPGPPGRFLASIPVLRAPGAAVAALALSVVGQLLGVLLSHTMLSAVGARVALAHSLVVVPLAMAAGFFPLTVAGMGAREAAFVALYRSAGVPAADALAASLLVFASQLALAGVGGLVSLAGPIGTAEEPRP